MVSGEHGDAATPPVSTGALKFSSFGYRAGAGTAPYTWCATGSPAPFTPCLVRAVYLTVRNFASTHPSAAPVFTRLHPFTTSPTWRR